MEILEQIEEKTKLTSQNVEDIFMDCLFKDGENTDNHVIGEGVMPKVGFNPERLKEWDQKTQLYKLDSECMGIDTVIEIFKSLPTIQE